MAKAIWEGRECDVLVNTDLEANWSVSILSGEYDPVSLIKRPAAPIVMKLRAKSRWLALDQGLRSLKAQGRISDYTLEPRPAEELAAAEAEKARLAAKKAAGAKASSYAASSSSSAAALARLRTRVNSSGSAVVLALLAMKVGIEPPGSVSSW
jgi:hypothetical protein